MSDDIFEGREEEWCPKCDEFFTPWITNCKCPRRPSKKINIEDCVRKVMEDLKKEKKALLKKYQNPSYLNDASKKP